MAKWAKGAHATGEREESDGGRSALADDFDSRTIFMAVLMHGTFHLRLQPKTEYCHNSCSLLSAWPANAYFNEIHIVHVENVTEIPH